MILNVQVEPSIARIYQAAAEERGTTMLDLMAAVLAFWPAAQWIDTQTGQQTKTQAETANPPVAES